MNDSLYAKIAAHVTHMFEEYPHEHLHYHNLDHTRQVVERAQEIAAHYQVKDKEMMALYAAAWFHDTGHLFADIGVHEEKSIELMQDFLKDLSVDEDIVATASACIRATQIPHSPEGLLEEIICDADTFHFGTKDFKKTNKLIKKEYLARGYNTFTIDWERNTLELLEHHHFFTSYCQVLLHEGKMENIEKARRKYLKAVNQSLNKDNEANPDDPKIVKARQSLVARGIQTMLRLTSENHLRLSDMADGKANILISVNSIIISVILSVLVRKLETEPYLTVPTILFLGFSVATVVIAIMATRPKVSEGRFSKADVMSKRINLLFFGNFYKSSVEEYEWAMNVMMHDKDYLYNTLVKDIHQLGVVLGRKYKLIRLAYSVFMVGILIAVLAFTLAVLLKSPADMTTVRMPSGAPL